MKKTLLVVLSPVLCALVCALAFIACSAPAASTAPAVHTHNYRWVDNGDDTHKQHCSVSGCDKPDINAGTHDYGAAGVCVCGKTKPTEGHTHKWSTEWSGNSAKHWRVCTECDEKNDEQNHVEGPAATATSPQVCTVCDYVLAEPIGHTHSTTLVPAKEASCTESGNVAYYICGCGKWFSYSAANDEIADKNSVIINALDHDWETEWTIDVEATTERAGSKSHHCSRCSEKTDVTEIPRLTVTTYNVIFNANGGKIDGQNTKTIMGTVNQTIYPPNNPVRTDYTFTGWYKYGTTAELWNFDSDVITGATTLYAGWKMNVPEYDVTFVHNYSDSTNAVKSTVDGLITYIPERSGYYFNGWWYSNGQTADGSYILSEKFDTSKRVTQPGLTLYAEWVQQRTSDSQLYSPSVSMLENGVFSWDSVDNAQGYKVEVYLGASKASEESLAVTSWAFPDDMTAGYYTIKIRANGDSETTVNSAWTEKYYSHHMLGYVDWRFNPATSVITWNAVKNATSYEVRVNGAIKTIITYTTYDLSDLDAGDYTVSITPVRENWVSLSQAEYTVNKKRIKTPTVSLTENNDCTYTVLWSAVAHADTYRIKHHDSYITVTGTSYTIYNDSPIYNGNGTGEFTVVAFDSNADYFISNDSESFEVKKMYSLTINKSDEVAGSVFTTKHIYKVGESVTIFATKNYGYTWLGWYDEDFKVSNNLNYSFLMPSENTIYTAKFEIDSQIDLQLENFIYTSTSTTLVITGVKDKSITNLNVPAYVTEIRRGAFSGCSFLESITLPFVGRNRKATTEDYDTFFGYIFGDCLYEGGMATEQSYTYYYNEGYSVRKYIYYIPSSLKSVTLMGGNILVGAFKNCNSLTRITISSDITSIGSYAFQGCNSLEAITYTGEIAGWCGISGLGNLMSYGKYDKMLTINGKEIVGEIVIPHGVTIIENNAFYNCNRLTNITISKSVTSIGWNAFYGCNKLVNIAIPDSVTSIGSYAFQDCISLASITIPKNVTNIGVHAFYGCKNLEIVYWNSSSIVECGNGNQPIFESCTKLTSVIIGGSVTNIADNAFKNCNSLISVTIPYSVTSIGFYAFQNCISLTNIEIPKSVTSIGWYAFSGCSSLISVTIPDGVTKILQYTFSGCSSLENITIPDSVIRIGNNAFQGCSSLTTIAIPNGIKSIEPQTFRGCSSLRKITIPNSVTSIGYNAFESCSSLRSIVIPKSVTTMQSEVFYNCNTLSIYCEAKSKPSGWVDTWCRCGQNQYGYLNHIPTWGYTK